MLFKKQRIVNLEIKKSGWTSDGKIVMNKRKVPLTRIKNNGCKSCIFNRFCSLWGPNYVFGGLDKIIQYKVGNSTVTSSGGRLCDCNESHKYNYIFIYNVIFHYIPTQVLIDMGLYEEHKISKKPKNYYDFPVDGKGKSNKFNKYSYNPKLIGRNKNKNFNYKVKK